MAYRNVKKVSPDTIGEFRQYDSDTYDIPELAKNRRCTDKAFLVSSVVFVVFTMWLAGYGTTDTDYNRFLYGYDKCGDSCGNKNSPIKGINCSGKDMTKKTYMQLKYYIIKNTSSKMIIVKTLADACSQCCDSVSQLYFNRCFPKSNASLDDNSRRLKTFFEFVHDLELSLLCIGVMSIIGLVLSLALFVFFRYCTRATIFSILFLHLIGLLCFSGYVWYLYVDDPNKTELLIIGIITVILSFFISIFICYFCDRYSLMVQLLKETMIAIFRMPFLLLQPLISIILICLLLTATIFMSTLLSTNSDLIRSKEDPSTYEYILSDMGISSLTFLITLAIWLVAFANGCQCMIVAGAIAASYFTRKKSFFFLAPFVSCYILVRYHLGTIVFGSLVITFLMIARISVEFLRNHSKCKNLLSFLQNCVTLLEMFIDYLTKRAYIQTAIHGKPLYPSGIRAARLLWSNLLDKISLDVVGDFIMFCALILIMLVATTAGIVMNYNQNLTYFWTVLIVGVIIAGTITYFFTQLITVAIETLFICFCEDKLLNDGKDRPYFMSEELAELVHKAKTASRQRYHD